MNEAPIGLEISFPVGTPDAVPCEGQAIVPALVEAYGGGVISEPNVKIHISADGGPFVEIVMTPLGNGLFEGILDGTQADNSMEWFVSGELTSGLSQISQTFFNVLADNIDRDVEDFEAGNNGWTVETDASVSAGAWELVEQVPWNVTD